MTATYRQSEIYFETSGAGKPLVLLHGFLENSSIWKEAENQLRKENFVIKVDLPGHGKSGCIGYIHTMEEMADAIISVFSILKIEKASFIGHSMGGYVSLAFAEKYPDLVEKIVLLNSTPAADSEERKENREKAAALVKKNAKAFVTMAISNLLPPENNKKFKKEISELKNEALNMPVQGIVAAIEGMKIRKDRTEFLKDFQNQKIIIAGENDPVLPYMDFKNTSKYCKTDFFTLNGGHLSFIEDQEELLKLLHSIFQK